MRNFKSAILFATVSVFFFTGCKKELNSDSSASSQNISQSQATSENAAGKAVHILAVYDFSTFPNVSGTFTTWGALGDNVKGTTTMDIGLIDPNNLVAHCVVVLNFADGTITLKQECEFASPAHVWPDAKGQWQIVSGTGAYAGIKGNGRTTMPPLSEDMIGVIL